jgi:flagellar basal-body rod protein FlgC
MIDFNANVSALRAFSVAQQVTAHNVANVNTEEFRASRTVLEEIPNRGGVRVQEVRQTSGNAGFVPVDKPVANRAGELVQSRLMVRASNTNIAREMTNMISNENAFAANAAAIRTRDDMIGGLINELA